MNALAGLMNPAAVGQQVMGAFEAGREKRREVETRNALAAYAQNPSAESASQVAVHNPMLGIQLGQQETARAEAAAKAAAAARRSELIPVAAQGDKTAMLELWGVDPEMAIKLDDRQADEMVKGMEYIAQSALAIDGLPEAQRAAAWDQAVEQGVQLGYDGLAQYRGQYSPEALQSVVAQAGEMDALLGNRRPRYQVIPEGGVMVDTSNPEAVQQYRQQYSRTIGDQQYFQNPETGEWFDNAQEAGLGGTGSNVGANFLDGF